MIDGIDVCGTCGAGGHCTNCLGTGADRMDSNTSCMSCGGSGEEPPRFSSCDPDECTAEDTSHREVRI